MAREFIRANFESPYILAGDTHKEIEELCSKYKDHLSVGFDYLISFINPYIIPKELLEHCKVAINFHTAPPKYPGTGGYSMAIYNKDRVYGVTAHYIDEKVDHGEIFHTLYFPIFGSETINQLLHQSHFIVYLCFIKL